MFYLETAYLCTVNISDLSKMFLSIEVMHIAYIPQGIGNLMAEKQKQIDVVTEHNKTLIKKAG